MLPFVWIAEQSSLRLTLGRAELGLGDLDAAAAALTEALRLSELTHVTAARRGQVLLALAELRLAQGDTEAASRRYSEAESLAEEALADDDRYPPMLDLVAGRIAARRGALEEASARFARARRALIESNGFTRGLLADVDVELAALALRDGRSDEAEEAIGEAMFIRREIMGRDHITVAPLLEMRAQLRALDGEDSVAADDRARAEAIRAAWVEREERRARACSPLARMLTGIRPNEPAARAAALRLHTECGAAGVGGVSYSLLGMGLSDASFTTTNVP